MPSVQKALTNYHSQHKIISNNVNDYSFINDYKAYGDNM